MWPFALTSDLEKAQGEQGELPRMAHKHHLLAASQPSGTCLDEDEILVLVVLSSGSSQLKENQRGSYV